MLTLISEDKLRSIVLDTAIKYNYEREHSAFVENTALQIFDMLKHVHKLNSSDRVLLSHASILHDIGTIISKRKHNKYSKYLIDHSETMSKYPEAERHLLSLIVYNHRKKIHKETLLLSKKERDNVLKLSAILRVADALGYTRQATITDIDFNGSAMEFTIDGTLPERINFKLEKKKELFVEIFDINVLLRP